MTRTVLARLTIASRYTGPPGSANGGYTCGLLAATVVPQPGPDAAVVTLRRPPPLQVPLDVVPVGAGVELRLPTESGDALIAEAAPARLDAEVVPPVSVSEASDAAARYGGLQAHPFPGCFVCGTAREPGDGLRLMPGRVGESTVAALWRPQPDTLGAEFVWAALDCPGGWAVELSGRPMVLGRMTAKVEALPEPGESVVVMGRLLGQERRKTFSVTTAYDADGRVLGLAAQVWIVVDPATLGPPAS